MLGRSRNLARTRPRAVALAGALALTSAACTIDVMGALAPGDAGADASSVPDATLPRPGDEAGADGSAADGAPSGDASPPDAEAGADAATGPCPLVCNGGCSPTGACRIDCPACTKPVVCPPGRDCIVTCTGNGACGTGVTCAPGRACRVECGTNKSCENMSLDCTGAFCSLRCLANQSCNSATITGQAAGSLCLECAGNQGCNSLTCSRPLACTKRCDGNGCNGLGGCETCATSLVSCP